MNKLTQLSKRFGIWDWMTKDVEDRKAREEAEEYRQTHSNCCDALLVNDMCMDCKEHAGPQKDD